MLVTCWLSKILPLKFCLYQIKSYICGVKYIGKEKDFQIAVANYLRSIGAIFHHSPNEGVMKPQYGALRKKQGVSSGVPDLLIFDKVGNYNGLAIELKVGYNKPTKEQLEWGEALKNNGWLWIWSNDIDVVIDAIDKYFTKKLN